MSITQKIKQAIQLALLVIFFTGFSGGVLAQTPAQGGFYGLIITPVKKEYIIERGNSVTGSFDIRHDYSDANLQIKLYPFTNDFTSDNKTGIPHLVIRNPNKSVTTLEDWITVDNLEYSLDFRGDKETVNYTITVPIGVNPGSYYAAIILSDTKDFNQKLEDNEVSITSRLGFLLLVTVPGEIVSNLEILDIKLTDYQGITPLFNLFESQPVNVVTTLSNNGNVYLVPGGDVFIHQGDISKPLFTQAFNEPAAAVLSGSYREFTAEWNDGFARYDKVTDESTGETKYQFSLHPESLSKFYLGKYQVAVKVLFQVNPNGEFKIIEKNAEFWIIPWRLILALIIFLIFIIIWKKYRRKKLKRQQVKHETSQVAD